MKFTYPKKPKLPKRTATLSQIQAAEQKVKTYNEKVKEVDKKKSDYDKALKAASNLRTKTNPYKGKGFTKPPKFPKSKTITSLNNYITKYAEWEKKSKDTAKEKKQASDLRSKLEKQLR